MGFLDKHIFRIFPNESSLFVRTTPKQYFFDGIPFCVEVDDITNFVCKLIYDIVKHRNIKAIRKVSDGSLKFAFFYYVNNFFYISADVFTKTFHFQKNNTHDGQYKILSGLNDSILTSQILTWQGKPHLTIWDDEAKSVSSCNLFEKSTDGVLFPPHLKPEGYVNVFSTDICRWDCIITATISATNFKYYFFCIDLSNYFIEKQ